MAVVVFEMIAFGFQGVVVFVLDFPAGSSACTIVSTLVRSKGASSQRHCDSGWCRRLLW